MISKGQMPCPCLLPHVNHAKTMRLINSFPCENAFTTLARNVSSFHEWPYVLTDALILAGILSPWGVLRFLKVFFFLSPPSLGNG